MPVLPSPSIHEAITPFGKSFEGSIPPLPPSKKAVVAAAAPSREEDASAAAASAASDAKKTTGQNRIAGGSQGGAAAGEPAEEDDVHLPEDEGGPRSSAPCRPPGDLGSRRGIPFPEQALVGGGRAPLLTCRGETAVGGGNDGGDRQSPR